METIWATVFEAWANLPRRWSATSRRSDSFQIFLKRLNNMAMCLCSMNRMEEGIEKFREVIRLRPTIADVHNNLGVALIELRRFEEAGDSFQTAVDIKPDHAEAHNNLARDPAHMQRPQEAIPCFRQGTEINPEFASARSNLAAAIKEVGKQDESLEGN